VRAEPTDIPGCSLVALRLATDDRGDFVKLFQRSVYEAAGLDATVAEVFFSRSHRGVVRGLHFQLPPHDHAKTVACLQGTVLDVVVDLRVGSPTYARHACFRLDASEPLAVHVPTGCAHGFQALGDDALMAYLVSSEHSPEHDTGIRFDSAGVEWPLPVVGVSERDRALPPFDALDNPFRHRAEVR
jgi:dTDP-4-dehydrorhamnose 3,5-epimerase